jgi:hypothetical protein
MKYSISDILEGNVDLREPEQIAADIISGAGLKIK